MRLTAALRHKDFGNLYKGIRGIVYYQLSPFEQRPFAGAWTHGLPNIFRRTFPEIFYWLPPQLLGAAVYYFVERSNRMSKRKNPSDYVNEVDPNPPPPPKCD